ncbi:MAG: type I methionyl aminopeptidase [Deltaproteobacteria bacterium]|nr:type I methionyl aminopeptidase [Deltaproteobacteria bacterium]
MIVRRSQGEIDLIRSACQIVAETLARLSELVRPGISTGELDRYAEQWTRESGAEPAFKGYVVGGRVYPATLCVSINEEVVHGMPSPRRVLADGDIVGLDFGVVRKGYYGDGALTVGVGQTSREAHDLIRVTREALDRGIEKLRVGNRIRDVSEAIQTHAEAHGYGVVRDFVGHGIGQRLHEEPQVPNYVSRGQNPRLKEGMVLAIEPMVCAGTYEVEVLEDGWTAVTKDRRLSAHFEHSVAVTANGPEILTSLGTEHP